VLIWELQKLGLKVEAQRPITVHYDGQVVGIFTADLLVNDSLILELKASQLSAEAYEVQVINYLVTTGIDEGLLLNFGAERLGYKKKFRLPKQEQVLL
jgi:GxxExxY protein